MEVNLKTVRKVSDQVNKIVSWVKEHKGIVLIVAAVIIVIGFLIYGQCKKPKLSQDKNEKSGKVNGNE